MRTLHQAAWPRATARIRAHARDALTIGLGDHPWWAGPLLVLVFSPIIGLATGSFSVYEPARATLMLYAAIKVPLLLLVTTAICLPPFFVMHAALGVRRDFPVSLRAVLAAQAVTALVLASLAPWIPIFYSVTDNKNTAVLGCGACFAAAALCSLITPARAFRTKSLQGRTHRSLIGVWFILYALVGTQLGWMLRPFVGTTDIPPAFLRDEPFTNGYVVVFRMFFGG